MTDLRSLRDLEASNYPIRGSALAVRSNFAWLILYSHVIVDTPHSDLVTGTLVAVFDVAVDCS